MRGIGSTDEGLGYGIDWTLKVRYRVMEEGSKQALYQSEKVTQRNTAKFVNDFGALNETIKLNVEELVKDAAFIKTIN